MAVEINDVIQIPFLSSEKKNITDYLCVTCNAINKKLSTPYEFLEHDDDVSKGLNPLKNRHVRHNLRLPSW